MIFVERKAMTARGPVVYHCPYFEELVATGGNKTPERVLPRDLQAHALWYYYCLASKAIDIANKCLVLETERSPKFRPNEEGRQLIQSIASIYGFKVAEIVQYWDVIERQRMALGLSQNAELPAVFKFRFN